MSTTVTTTEPPPGREEHPPPVTRTHAVYLVVVAVLAAAAFAAVGIVNARTNPYVYDDDAIAQVAQGLADGKNLANYDANVDLRKLRKEQIQRMPAAPDVVIFGGSRWQEARSEIIPGGHRVYNAYVSNDQVEDMLALTNILDKAGKLPKTMLFSLRFVSVQGISQRTTYDWKGWESDYSEMAGRLGVSPASYLDRAPVQQWSGQYYFPDVFTRWQQLGAAKAAPTLTSESETQHLDVIAADGSLHWSQDSKAKFTRKFVDKAVDKEILTVGPTQPGIDRGEVELMGKLIDWLHGKGVKVIVAQSPYRPDYWQRIQSYPFAKTLHGLEDVATELQARHGAIAYNHYDPAGFPNCTLDNFVDHIHPTWKCLQDVFADLPDLVTGVKS
ncbi:hypothetical protein [Amycolatopsis plumensis]|uniref:SGNH/GDSL hydrolase family protein n=1 Tax=Amycolatopsis plumensis TaxID=236508 RepID=A0ABV5UFZ3_9PSEU